MPQNPSDLFLAYYTIGYRSPAVLARVSKTPLRTVYYWLSKLRKQGNLDHLPRKGRPRKLSGHEVVSLIQTVRHHPERSSKDLAEGSSCSSRTLRRYLSDKGYTKKKPRFVPLLTTLHKEKRLQFARAHLHDDWSRTVFSDETSMQLEANAVKLWCKKSKTPIKGRPKNRKKIMAWGGFSATMKTPLATFDEIMDSKVYTEILAEFLVPSVVPLGTRWRFQQDNDPKHTSRFTRGWLADRLTKESLLWNGPLVLQI
jgi:transposase